MRGTLLDRRCVSRRRACALAFAGAFVLCGCAAQQRWGQVDLPSSLRGLVNYEAGESRSLQVATIVQGESGSEVSVVPFRLNDAGLIVVQVEAMGPFAGAKPVAFEAVLDTGDPDALSLPRRTAERIRPWLRPGPPSTMTSPFSARRTYTGAILRLRIGAMTAGPVPISMDDAPRAYLPVIGLGYLRNFKCVIIDWGRGEILLVRSRSDADLAGRFAAETWGWTEVPLIELQGLVEQSAFPIPEEGTDADDDVAASRHQLDLIAVEASIGNQSLSAVLDTGGSGDVLAFRALPTVSGTEQQVRASSAGQTGTLVRADLAAPLQVGEVSFDPVQVYRIRGDDRAEPPEGFPDIALGNGLLRRHAIWIDFERRVVRFGRCITPADDSSDHSRKGHDNEPVD